NQAKVGAGVYSDLFSFYAAVGHNRSAFEGEKGTSRCNELKARTKEKQWSEALSDIADWPRIEVVAEFGLRTGHDCLTKHLHKLGVYTQPTWPLCNLQEAMGKTHLIRCLALKTTAEKRSLEYAILNVQEGGVERGREVATCDPLRFCQEMLCAKKTMGRLNTIECFGLNTLNKHYRVFWSKHLEEAKRKRDALRNTADQCKRDALRNTADQTGRDALCNTADQTGKRNALRNTADQTGTTEDVKAWRRQSAVLRQAILQAKRTSFDKFISNINYQSDSQRTFKFLRNLQNNREKPKKEPIRLNSKLLTTDNEIANCFARFYSHKQKKNPFVRKSSRDLKIQVEDTALVLKYVDSREFHKKAKSTDPQEIAFYMNVVSFKETGPPRVTHSFHRLNQQACEGDIPIVVEIVEVNAPY
ncbi:unnamed protein product, partial [Rodentolepis nana]|uniref:Protein kinase domain-containing protein n=1 Tax=Rodentolepis nana TaxID=102285 RepID=A0A0R3TXZ2_RODNA